MYTISFLRRHYTVITFLLLILLIAYDEYIFGVILFGLAILLDNEYRNREIDSIKSNIQEIMNKI